MGDLEGLVKGENVNEQEKMMARACLALAFESLEELRALPSWWRLVSEKKRSEFKEFMAFLVSARNGLE